VLLAIGLVILLSVAAWQVRTIIGARHPTVRAIGALATTVPLFLLLFAATYFLMARTTPASFSDHLTRTDALYFTVTTFSTVGYGDITAVSESARLVVIVQMILDLLALGLGIRYSPEPSSVAASARSQIPPILIARHRMPDPVAQRSGGICRTYGEAVEIV
jgi:voltage-gated potassium channel